MLYEPSSYNSKLKWAILQQDLHNKSHLQCTFYYITHVQAATVTIKIPH